MAEWTDFQWYGKSHIRFDPIFFIGSTVIFFLHIYRNTKLLIFIFYNIWRDLTNSLELPNLINKNTWCAVKLECQINDEYIFYKYIPCNIWETLDKKFSLHQKQQKRNDITLLRINKISKILHYFSRFQRKQSGNENNSVNTYEGQKGINFMNMHPWKDRLDNYALENIQINYKATF